MHLPWLEFCSCHTKCKIDNHCLAQSFNIGQEKGRNPNATLFSGNSAFWHCFQVEPMTHLNKNNYLFIKIVSLSECVCYKY